MSEILTPSFPPAQRRGVSRIPISNANLAQELQTWIGRLNDVIVKEDLVQRKIANCVYIDYQASLSKVRLFACVHFDHFTHGSGCVAEGSPWESLALGPRGVHSFDSSVP